MKRLGLWLTEAAIAGVPMIPLFIYVTSFFRHEGSFIYVLPFVIFYSFNKTATFMLGVFGQPTNPYRIAQVAAAFVIAGAGLSLFGEASLVFSDVGATLIGLGTGVFGTMYRAVKEILRNEGRFPGGRPELVGFGIMTVFVAFTLLTRGHLEELIIAAYVALSVVSLLTLRGLDVDGALKTRPLFDTSQRDIRKGIPALAFLAIVLFVRLFKQTANVHDILWVLVLTTAVTVVVVVRRQYLAHQTFEYHGVFYSEVFIFAVLFDIFLFFSQGAFDLIIGSTLCMFVGNFCGLAWGKAIVGHFPNAQVSNVLVLLTMVALGLFLVPWLNLPMLGVLAFLSQLGHIRVSGLYHKVGHLDIADLYITNQKMFNIGIVVGQAILVGVLAIVSAVMLGSSNAAIASYAFHMPKAGVGSVFDVTQVICDISFWVQGIVLLALEKRRLGFVFRPAAS